MSKVICPNCRSENLTYFKEFYFTKYYRLNENNEPITKLLKKTKPDNSGMPENWKCEDCGLIFGGTSQISCAYKED